MNFHESSNDAPLNKAKAIKVEIQQKGGILTPKYVKTSPSAIQLIGNETSMQRSKSDNNMQQRMFESKQLAQRSRWRHFFSLLQKEMWSEMV